MLESPLELIFYTFRMISIIFTKTTMQIRLLFCSVIITFNNLNRQWSQLAIVGIVGMKKNMFKVASTKSNSSSTLNKTWTRWIKITQRTIQTWPMRDECIKFQVSITIYGVVALLNSRRKTRGSKLNGFCPEKTQLTTHRSTKIYCPWNHLFFLLWIAFTHIK